MSSVAKNTIVFSLALVLQKALSFVYFTLIARIIGVDLLGEYLAALSFAMIFSLFMDMGLSQVLIRETSRYKEHAYTYLGNVLGAKFFISIISFLLLLTIIWLLDQNNLGHPPMDLVMLAGLAMIFDNVTLSLYSMLRGYTHLGYESIGTVLHRLIVMSFGLLFLLSGFGINSLMVALMLGGIGSSLYLYIIIWKKWKIIPSVLFDMYIWKKFFYLSWPFALAGLFAAIFANIDSVFLRVLLTQHEVGIYGVASKMTGALQFIPLALVAAIYPAMSKYYPHQKEKVAEIFQESLKYLIIISLPITFGVFVIAKPIILVLYGSEYMNSVTPLLIMMAALLFIFLNFPVGYVFNACNRQLQNTINLGIAVGLNVVLNIVLIPLYGVLGAAVAVFFSYLVYFIIGMFIARKLIKYPVKPILSTFVKTLMASLLMYITLLTLLPHMPIVFIILTGVIIYTLALFVLRVVTINEIQSFLQLLKRKT